MPSMLKTIIAPFWKIYAKRERELLKRDEKDVPFVVTGFQRSGTSLICNMLNSAGVYFGEDRDLMHPDDRNPKGFFEHNTIFRDSRKFLKQAGFRDDMYHDDLDMRAKGPFNKMMRICTRMSMMKTLAKLANFPKGKYWTYGMKSFPNFFYFWKRYMPNYKIVAVYRDPLTVAHGFMKAWPQGKYTFEQVLQLWAKSNRDLLYHISVAPSILIKYEDLFDENKKSGIATELVKFLGHGDASVIAGLVESGLNRSGSAIKKIEENYPVDQSVKDVFYKLEAKKISV